MARSCTICAHSKRAEIDAALARGESQRSIASRYGSSQASVDRHRPHVAKLLLQARQERLIAPARTLDGLITESHADLNDAREWARAAEDASTMAKLVQARIKLAELEFKATAPPVQVSVLVQLGSLPVQERRERLVEMKHRVLELEAELDAEEPRQ